MYSETVWLVPRGQSSSMNNLRWTLSSTLLEAARLKLEAGPNPVEATSLPKYSLEQIGRRAQNVGLTTQMAFARICLQLNPSASNASTDAGLSWGSTFESSSGDDPAEDG